MMINGYTQDEQGCYIRQSDGVGFETLEDVFKAVQQQWSLSRSYIAANEKRFEAAKKAAKQLSEAEFVRQFPELATYQGMVKIEKEHDAQMREVLRAMHAADPASLPDGVSTRQADDVQINEVAALKWAIENRPEWLQLTDAARKAITVAFSDRMDRSYGTLPEHLAKFVEDGKVTLVIKDDVLLNGKKNVREELG